MESNQIPENSVTVQSVWPADWKGEAPIFREIEGKPGQIRTIINQPLPVNKVVSILLLLLKDRDKRLAELLERPQPSSIGGMNFYTDVEAAKLLRCAPVAVSKLRLSGELAYVALRSALIPEDELVGYIKRKTRFHGAPDTEQDVQHPQSPRILPTPSPIAAGIGAPTAGELIARRQLGEPGKRPPLSDQEKRRRAAEVELKRQARERKKAEAKARKAREAGPS